MGNLGTMFKRFIGNKNTVTLIVIVIGVVVLYGFYNWRVKSAVTTTYVCAATKTIPARTQITEEMVSQVKVLSSQVTPNMITSCDAVKGKYVSYATEIQPNSYFYEKSVMDKEEMPNSAFDDIPDGFTIYNLAVTFESTYANSIFPGDFIDLYLKTEDEGGALIYGKFIQSIKVLGVKDAEGQNVFETTVETREPSQLLFAVPDDLYLLLKRAEYLGMEIVVVPRNNNYTAEAGETLKSSEYLVGLIENQTGTIDDECVNSETGVAECENNGTVDDNANNNQGDNNPDDNNGNQGNEPTTPEAGNE